MSATAPITIPVIQLWPHESECICCGRLLFNCRQGIPMYEGDPVPHDWEGGWAGFDACPECFAEYEAHREDAAQLEAWWRRKRFLNVAAGI